MWIQKKSPVLLFVIALSFYLFTLAPVVTFVDSGELAAVVGTRGVSHPTGSPLYSLLGSFVATIPIGTLIQRLNAFSALCAAISVVFTYLLFLEICKIISPKKKIRTKDKKKLKAVEPILLEWPWPGATAAALAWMTNRALWNTATVTEVYALHAMLISIFCFCLVAYTKNTEPASRKYLAFACVTAGLGFSNYPPIGILAVAALFYLYRKRSMGLKLRNNLWMLGLIAGGLLPYALLPIRANSDPLLNWGNPCNWERFWNHVSGAQYKIFLGKPNLSQLPEAFSLWWDQWPVAIWFLILPGIVFLFWSRRDEFYFTLLVGIANIFYVLSYDILDVSSAPTDYYSSLLPLCWASAIWIGAGTQAIVEMLRSRAATRPYLVRTISIVLLAIIPTTTALAFWPQSNRRDYVYADDFARSVLLSLPQDAFLLTNDWAFVSPSLYLQHVENVRPDVIVLDSELLRRSWYFKYLRKRAPWLERATAPQIGAFITELLKYERGEPYDGNLITQKYVGMLNSFISTALNQNHPPHILLNLEAKEAEPKNYREWELTLGRPPFVTSGVIPNEIGKGYQWVPDTLAFRLYNDNEFRVLTTINIPPRPIDQDRKYDAVTRGIFTRYAEFWRWRGDYSRFHQRCNEALTNYERANKIIDNLPEVTEGISECARTQPVK
jgi:hypothetical protein